VLLTPHIGGATVDVTRHQSEIVVDAIERWLAGERPRFLANPAVLDRRA
jgi:D-3-phosphoglycerate dehydrogenase